MNSIAKMHTGKTQYMSEAEAYAMAAKILRFKNAPASLRVYQCPICNYFHLTKKEKL